MSPLCLWFGHSLPRTGWWGDGLYGKIGGGQIDGIGRTHFTVRHECPRCGKNYIAARFHGHDVTASKALGALKLARGVEIPDFLKRMTGELPPAPSVEHGEDDGREGRREGAEEDPDPLPDFVVRGDTLAARLHAAGMAAKLPAGYQWGSDAMESFDVGKRQAVDAIMQALGAIK